MGLLNMTPQRESRLRMSLRDDRYALAMQLIETLKTNPIGVHVTFSNIIELCRTFDSIGSIISYLTQNKQHFSLSGIAQLCTEQIHGIEVVNAAYQNARWALEKYNRRHPISIDKLTSDLDNTPNCWEFTGFTDTINWITSDNVVIQNKNLGKYKAQLDVRKWEWCLYREKSSDSYQHPHVSYEGYPCYGNAVGLMTAEKGLVKNLEGLWAFLHQYNEASAYAKLYTF